MEDRIAANDRYADLNSSDMRFLSAVGKGVLGDDCLIDCSKIPMIYCNYDTQDVVDITLDDLQVGHGAYHQAGTCFSVSGKKYILCKFGLFRFQESHRQ